MLFRSLESTTATAAPVSSPPAPHTSKRWEIALGVLLPLLFVAVVAALLYRRHIRRVRRASEPLAACASGFSLRGWDGRLYRGVDNSSRLYHDEVREHGELSVRDVDDTTPTKGSYSATQLGGSAGRSRRSSLSSTSAPWKHIVPRGSTDSSSSGGSSIYVYDESVRSKRGPSSEGSHVH